MHRRSSTQPTEYRIITFKNISQYASGGPSSCGLTSVNAVRTILTALKPGKSTNRFLEKEDTAVSIMEICQYWRIEEHLDVQDILDLPLFTCQLETVEVENNQSTLYNFRRLTRSLTRGGPCAAVLTRSPEIVSIMNIPSGGEQSGNLLVIFDSHPRPEHPLGAAFLVFDSPDDAASYLSNLFRVDASTMDRGDWQTQILSRYSAHIMRARPFTEEDNMKALYDANIKALKTTVAMKQALARERDMRLEINELRKRLEAQRGVRQQAQAAERDADQKLQTSRQNLDSARTLVTSLSGIHHTQVGQGTGSSTLADYPRSSSVGSPVNLYNSAKAKGRDPEIFDLPMTPPTKQASMPSVSGLHYQTRGTFGGSEAEEYEKVRLANIATKSAERKQKLLAEKETALRKAQEEAERRDFEMARQLQIEEERQSELLRNIIKCPICMDLYSFEVMLHVEPCGHAVCREDMLGHVSAALDQRQWPIVCPVCRAMPAENDEHGVVTRPIVEFAGADEALMSRWTDIEMSLVSVAVECPTCHNVAHIDREDYDKTLMLYCSYQRCTAYWCKACSQPAERGRRHTCNGQAEFDRWRDGNKDKVRTCPGCKQSIERTDGCRHMTCITPGCNTHFCDRCGGFIIKSQVKKDIDIAITDHYNNCDLFDVPEER